MKEIMDTSKNPTEETQAAETAPADNKSSAGAIDAVSLEDLRKENSELRERLALAAAREIVNAESKRAAAISPQLIFDSVKADLKFNEDGAATNAAALVADLKKRFPEQFGGAASAGTINGGAGAGASPMPLTSEMLARMTPAEIARLDWNDVRQVLSR